MKSRIDNLGDKANTNGFKEHPEHINIDGKEEGTLDYKTIAQMVVVGLKLGDDVRVEAIRTNIQMALIDKDWRALKELIDRLEGPIKQDIGIETTQPLLVFKSGQEEDVEKIKNL